MANKFQQKTKLMVKDGSRYTAKQFASAEFLPDSVMDTGTGLQIRLEEATKIDGMEAIRPILRECYDFIADVIFEKQSIGQEYIDGTGARKLLKITARLLGSVISGCDVTYSKQKEE